MTWLQRITLIIGASLVSPGLWAADLVGIWQNEEQPAWIVYWKRVAGLPVADSDQ